MGTFIIVTVLLVIALFFIVGMVLPQTVHVERSTLINAPAEKIFDQLNNLRNWNNWAVWNQKDPNWKVEYSGSEAGVGASQKWESKIRQVGNGSLNILKSEPYKLIQVKMNFMENGTASSTFTLNQLQEGVKVIWCFDGDAGANPIKRMLFLMLDKFIGADYEAGLNNLKNYVEKQ